MSFHTDPLNYWIINVDRSMAQNYTVNIRYKPWYTATNETFLKHGKISCYILLYLQKLGLIARSTPLRHSKSEIIKQNK